MSEDYASLDFETQAVFSLREVGTYRYAQDPELKAICLGWSINDDEVRVWKPGQPIPGALARHIERGGMLHAWHAAFERNVWGPCLPSFPQPKIHQWRCTMVRALAIGLPGALEKAAKAFRIPERKDTEGSKALQKLMRPKNWQKLRKGIDTTPIWHDRKTDPELFETVYRYNRQDVVTERAMGKRLPYLSPDEERQYWYDQRVADRGVRVDERLCRVALSLSTIRRKELAEAAVKLCGHTTTQVQAVRGWANVQLKKAGIAPLTDFKAKTIKKLAKNKALPASVATILKYRQEAGKTSTAKYEKILNYLCDDGTVKGLRQFNGSHTGRFAGRGPQFDNLLKPTIRDVDMDDVVAVVKTNQSWLIDGIFDSVLEPVANCVRSVIIAEEDHTRYVADYTSIESRMLALTSGQESTLEQWRLSDAGKGPDVYVANAADMFGVPLKVAADEEYRKYGKIAELSLGFQGGVGALAKNEAPFRDIYPLMHKLADDATRDKVNFLWERMGRAAVRGKENFNEQDWRGARYIVERWRRKNRMSTKLWKGLEGASIAAVHKPGTTQSYRGVSYRYDKQTQMLYCILMSGRRLVYPFAHLVTAPNHKGEPSVQLRAYYYSDKIKKFIKYHPYGGFLTENVIQAQSRDIMVSSFGRLEMRNPRATLRDYLKQPGRANGYKLIHTVHDEIITQAKRGSADEFIRLCTVVPPWAKGMPLAMEAWSGPRYKKK